MSLMWDDEIKNDEESFRRHLNYVRWEIIRKIINCILEVFFCRLFPLMMRTLSISEWKIFRNEWNGRNFHAFEHFLFGSDDLCRNISEIMWRERYVLTCQRNNKKSFSSFSSYFISFFTFNADKSIGNESFYGRIFITIGNREEQFHVKHE